MKNTITIPCEMMACIVEINADLKYLLDYGTDDEITESITLLNNRLETLLQPYFSGAEIA